MDFYIDLHEESDVGSSLETIVSGREINLYMTKLAKKISRYFMSEVVVANPPSNDLKAEE